MAELVDALVSDASGEIRGSSSLLGHTNLITTSLQRCFYLKRNIIKHVGKIHLSDHFTYKKILKFTIAPILMMFITSIYWVVDGFFLSNYASSSAFAGVNLIFPVIMIVACVGFMFGSGGAALVSKYLGEKNTDKANKTFSAITYVTIGVGLVLTFIFFFLVRPIAQGFAGINSIKTTKEMIDNAEIYGRIMIGGVTLFVMQGYFHCFFSVNETSSLGFIFSLASGLINMLLDLILVGVFKYGAIGAASASLCGMFISTIGPILYFSLRKKNLIRLGIPQFVFKDIVKTITNGSSEFVGNVSSSVISIVFNIQLLRYIGEDGVSAYGIIGYVCFIFFAVFMGYTVGISPVIAYNFGAKNKKELSNVIKKSFNIVAVVGLAMSVTALGLSRPLSMIFANDYPDLLELSTRAMMIYSVCYFIAGFSMFGSGLFTALNNGLLSALISVCRTLVFQIVAVFTLPLLMGVDGIWASIVVAELLASVMTLLIVFHRQDKYGYEIIPKKEKLF